MIEFRAQRIRYTPGQRMTAHTDGCRRLSVVVSGGLVESDARGTMELDSAMPSHAPDVSFDPALHADRITLRHLLTHTSGLDNEPIGFRVAFSGQHTPDTLWRLLGASAPDEKVPLGQFRYTNVGYNACRWRSTTTPCSPPAG